jgi:branched-chain amino acid transport system permease protein
MNYVSHLLIYLCIYAIVAMGLNIIIGYCGFLTLAQAGYFAIGSYTYTLATLVLGWGFIPSILLGAGLAMLLSLATSLPTWRLKGDFFVMVSLAVQVVILNAIYNWSSSDAPWGTLRNLTNGPAGISNVPKPDILGIKFDTNSSIALLAVIIAGLCFLLSAMMLNSPWGRALKATRDDELAARGLGKEVRFLKVQAFAYSCGITAIGGGVSASYVGFTDPSIASLDNSILMLCMVIIGGVGNIRGPVIGAVTLLLIPEMLRFVQLPFMIATEVRLTVYGLLLVLLMHFRPQGLLGNYRIE